MKKVAFLLLLAANLFANPLTFKNLQSEFLMEVKSNKTSIKYSGNLIISENKAYWHYQKPSLKDIYILNSNSFIQVDRDLEQVIFTRISDIPDFNTILKSAKEISKDKYRAIYDDVTYNVFFTNSKLSKITYIDKLDNEVEIKFINPVVDKTINDDVFRVKYPKNFDVIYN